MDNTLIKRKIIAATKEIIRKKGHFTVKDITDYCYINVASINYHFGSKGILTQIVVQELIDDLKVYLQSALEIETEENNIRLFIESLVNLLFSYGRENANIIKYLFLSRETQVDSVRLLIESFFADNEFSRKVFDSLRISMKTDCVKLIKSRYVLLFSALAIPVMIELLKTEKLSLNIDSLMKDSELRDLFVDEVLKLITN